MNPTHPPATVDGINAIRAPIRDSDYRRVLRCWDPARVHGHTVLGPKGEYAMSMSTMNPLTIDPLKMARSALRVIVPAMILWFWASTVAKGHEDNPHQAMSGEASVQVQYLEIVTPKVEETCAALAAQHGVTFGAPEAGLGNARVATLNGGGRIGVRAPMRDDEAPVVRPYLLVDDIQAATAAAEAAGAEFAMTATEIPGHGTFAIYFLGGIQHGLWEL